MTLKGTTTFKGFLVLALPESDNTAAAVGTFDVATNEASAAISQDGCNGVSHSRQSVTKSLSNKEKMNN